MCYCSSVPVQACNFNMPRHCKFMNAGARLWPELPRASHAYSSFCRDHLRSSSSAFEDRKEESEETEASSEMFMEQSPKICALCAWHGAGGKGTGTVQPSLSGAVWRVVKGFSAILGLRRFSVFNKHPSEQGRLVLVSLYAGTALFCSQ